MKKQGGDGIKSMLTTEEMQERVTEIGDNVLGRQEEKNKLTANFNPEL